VRQADLYCHHPSEKHYAFNFLCVVLLSQYGTSAIFNMEFSDLILLGEGVFQLKEGDDQWDPRLCEAVPNDSRITDIHRGSGCPLMLVD
jgi:hypothetical protein